MSEIFAPCKRFLMIQIVRSTSTREAEAQQKSGFISCQVRQLSPHPEKSGYDLNSETDLLWGDFQNPLLSDDIMP